MTTRDRSAQTPTPITTPEVTVADGKLTVKVHRYGWADFTTGANADAANNPTYQGLTDQNGDNVLATAAFDLEVLAGKGAGAKTTVDGPKWTDSVKATVQAQRDQIATLQALGTRTTSTRTAEAAAWKIAVNAIQYQLFGGHLPQKLVGEYITNTKLQEDAVGVLDRVLDALSNTTKLFAALDPEGIGIFDHYVITPDDPSTTGANELELGDFISYDLNPNTGAGERRWETTGDNRALGQFLDEWEHKVIASLGTTSYTRFGVWYRIGAASAERWAPDPDTSTADGNEDQGVKKNDGGPGSFSYSPLDPTQAAARRPFPRGSATYPGETVAIMDEDVLTGTAKVDLSWAASPDLDLTAGPDGTDPVNVSNAGTMSLTLDNLADGAGDPLTYTAVTGAPAQGHEIAEIVFSDMTIEVGLSSGRSGQLIVGAETEIVYDQGAASGDYSYGEAPATVASTVDSSNVRYRLKSIGIDDVPSAATGSASVGALFVGQGVDGPLGVIGKFTLTDPYVARVNAAGNNVEEGAEIIRGAFGVDVP